MPSAGSSRDVPRSKRRPFWYVGGPGVLVTAAFVGPGTVTTASVAGSRYAFTLAWTLTLSVVAAIVLQEMSSRLGIVTRAGLGDALRTMLWKSTASRAIVALLVVTAIGFGNAAYQAGNITGAALALAEMTGWSRALWSVAVGAFAGIVLWIGTYRPLEWLLIGLVIVMSALFVGTAAIVKPAIGEVAVAAVVPRIPRGATLTVISLIGTTVVPYNLFLHASLVGKKWGRLEPEEALRRARVDTVTAILLGGLVTLAIMGTAAAAFYGSGREIETGAEMPRQLEPLVGAGARYCFAAGLWAAGLSSAITAPLAAAWAVAGVMGWPNDIRRTPLRVVWIIVLVSGTTVAAVGTRPVHAIVVAQAANGLLLPLVAVFLIVVMNQRRILGEYANGIWSNGLGILVVSAISALGIYRLVTAFL